MPVDGDCVCVRVSAVLADGSGLTADQLAAAFCRTPFDRDRYAIDGDRLGGRNNLVDPMRFASGVELRTIDLVSEPRDRATPNVVIGRAADDGSSVIRFISDCDDF